MNLRKIIASVVLCCCSVASFESFALEVKQGVIYQAGTLVESSELGAAFNIPQGWQGAWPPGTEFFVLESSNLQANMFMLFDTLSKQQLSEQMSQTIALDGGIALQPQGAPTSKNKLLSGRYTVIGSPQSMQAYVVARELRTGLSVALIALSRASASQVDQVADSLLAAMQSRAVKLAQPQLSNTAGGQSWQEYMRGRYIARFYTGSGYHEKQELWLCSDGTFYSSFNAGGFSMSGASGAIENGGRGLWKAQGSTAGTGTLILQFGAGKVSQGSAPGFDWSESSAGGERRVHQLALNDKLYLDNKQWLRGDNNYCR